MLRIRSLLVLIVLLLPAPAPAVVLEAGAEVVDGDTLRLGDETVRLHGIDAPELDQTCDRAGQVWACGQWSREVLAGAVAGNRVTCTGQDRDRYGRLVASCRAGGADLAAAQVAAGAAMAYRRYSTDHIPAERRARAAGLGIWSGAIDRPEDHRAEAAARTAAQGVAAPQGCNIKGNVSAKGVRIYHLPGQEHYAGTVVSPRKGEAWFCTEAEAQAAGFRRARR